MLSIARYLMITACCLLSAACCLIAVRAENWPQWRGPMGAGISKETGMPVSWSEPENVIWKLPMPGMAGSTPIVWGERIFLTSEADKGLMLLCVSTDGKELWTKPLSTSRGRHARGDEGCAASASPCTDGKHVYSFVGTGDFACH